MKTILTLIVLASSVNVFAYSVTYELGLTSQVTTLIVGVVTSGKSVRKEAGQVLKDSQEYIASGKLSVFLQAKINDKISQDESLTIDEALEIMVDEAQVVLDSNR